MGLAKKPIINKGHLFLSIANEGEHMQAPFTDITQHLKKLMFTIKKNVRNAGLSFTVVVVVMPMHITLTMIFLCHMI